MFADADERHEAVGEGSTHYLYSRVAVDNILDYQPGARFVVGLRNPIEMAPALHDECLRQGWETVRRFERAWRLQARRRAGRNVPFTARRDPERLLYGPYCRLGEQLARLYARVERARVLPILLDDLRQDPGREYRRVLTFLGVADDGRESFPAVNTAPQTRSVAFSLAIRGTSLLRDALWLPRDWGLAAAMRRLNTRPARRKPLSTAMREELRGYFADDIERLGRLLDRDLSGWLAGRRPAAHRGGDRRKPYR